MALNFSKPVVTPDDFFNMFGISLYEILDTKGNDSNYPFIFIRNVQDYLQDWCDEHGFMRMHYNNLHGIQLEYFQKAVLNHIYYTWKNGAVALGLDSGYDAEKGKIISIEDIKAIEVPTRVITLLHKCGLFNLKLHNRPRYSKGWPGIGGPFTGEDY